MSAVTGRFAPTPSGRLHLGNLLCALIAYLSARSLGGRFLLRIEDLDAPRCPRTLARQAMEDLSFLGITWDEPPLYQSERGDIYRRHLHLLSKRGLLYPCFCSRAQLHAAAAPNRGDEAPVYNGACAHLSTAEIAQRSLTRHPAQRLRVPAEHIGLVDGHCGFYSEYLPEDCGDFIVQRSDGLAAYQLAVVVDDALSGITQVVRGRDILSSTPRQLYLYQLFGYASPDFFHIPLLEDAKGRRLAKRDGDLDLTTLSRCFSPAQIRGMLAASAGILSENRPAELDELIALFDWSHVRQADIRLPESLFMS